MTDVHDTELKKDLAATLHARRDLGPEYESELVDSFLEKIDRRIDTAVERGLRRGLAEQRMQAARGAGRTRGTDSWGERFGFGIVSLVLAIPLSAISGAFGGVTGVIVTWIGIVGVNATQAVRLNPGLFQRGDRGQGD
ncbi:MULTISPECIES: hypothetical protein [unclassified Streptomyces]|jgi:hypothetical protein|uniref:Integral membrane protein n=1 Tax=Streptomyces sp. 900105755 TaxID=3154389 RepID=A0ABV1TU58_9ACTN